MESEFKTVISKSSSNPESQFILVSIVIFVSVIVNLKDFQYQANEFNITMVIVNEWALHENHQRSEPSFITLVIFLGNLASSMNTVYFSMRRSIIIVLI